jgi:hypothetical protein
VIPSCQSEKIQKGDDATVCMAFEDNKNTMEHANEDSVFSRKEDTNLNCELHIPVFPRNKSDKERAYSGKKRKKENN